ncbi:9910_t:CDS:1 [Dentiscutata erythropus]|uniref:9910_t:CDS:1 n=1 Tax=Dentiscutata erythropus TaxID=1348616 RepID=A0A9N9N5T7_9GLOM|nr:9910_t:CDS:1 [Dentiscutata erythropus]
MSMICFQQIKRYLHISDINSEKLYWFDKVEPLMSHVRNISKQMYVPGSNVAIDEMIVWFSGHSKHTFKMKNKSISEGYKIISLCEKGYTYTFVLESHVENNNEIQSIFGLSKTGSLVSYLVMQLSNSRAYNIYMDNYFASMPLFNYLRIKGYGACSTVRTNSAIFSKELKVEKSIRLNWDTLARVVVNNVLIIFWMDNSPVHMLSTIHGIKDNE